MRMQPWEADLPIELGTLVPWIPKPRMLSPIHRVPSGFVLPGGTTTCGPYQVGLGIRLTTRNAPSGLGVDGLPTATSYTRTTLSPSSSASL